MQVVTQIAETHSEASMQRLTGGGFAAFGSAQFPKVRDSGDVDAVTRGQQASDGAVEQVVEVSGEDGGIAENARIATERTCAR